VSIADDGESGLNQALRQPPDLVLLDLGLPGLDGLDVCRQLRAGRATASVPIIMITARVDETDVVSADRRRLSEMLTNLVDNALKFNSPGGHAWIRGRDEEGKVVLLVEDDGIGIPAKSLELIFHRFYQVNRAGSRETRGTGLGLAIVKHLMRLDGGRVRLEAELGRGSSFSLEFPKSA
jgi:signal transduction histidine kinase